MYMCVDASKSISLFEEIVNDKRDKLHEIINRASEDLQWALDLIADKPIEWKDTDKLHKNINFVHI